MTEMNRNPVHPDSDNGIWLVIDRENSNCGITDRLKAAVGLYYVARVNGLGFHFVHQTDFDIRDYLAPNRVDWSAELSGIDAEQAVPIRYVWPYDDFPTFRKDRQYVCREYIGNNILEKQNVPDWQKQWRGLFRDLFMPTALVRDALTADALPAHYTAVVLRFINSLGHTENADYNKPLPEKMQAELIEAALRKTAECEREAGTPAVIYSDSARFLRAAAESGFRITDINGIGNIMNGDVEDYVTLRTFVNMFQMAGAEKVYSILHLEGMPENSLYKTQYPRYAAIIGNRPFIRL